MDREGELEFRQDGIVLPRVLFGSGCSAQLPAELERLGARRALVLATAQQSGEARRATDSLGERRVRLHAGARMHVPVESQREAVEIARECTSDSLVSFGGGSATGLAKAVALQTGLPIVALPTTYAGSEMTSIHGLTENGIKRTGRDPRVLPRTVLYDPDLTLSLPVDLSIASAFNALAHAVEGAYARERGPLVAWMCEEGIAALAQGLPRIAADPRDREGRVLCLRGAWYCGAVLGTAAMGLHHKLCHVLGGSFALPHAETHAVLLPHVLAWNEDAAPRAAWRIARALDTQSAADGLHALAVRLGAPLALEKLGLRPSDLDRATDLASSQPYENPKPTAREEIRALLDRALRGEYRSRGGAARARRSEPSPAEAAPAALHPVTRDALDRLSGVQDPRLREIVTRATEQLHGFVTRTRLQQAEWLEGIRFLTAVGQASDAKRQEMILLSDVLGVSVLVDALRSTDLEATPSTVLGPFWLEGAPELPSGASIAEHASGAPCFVSGRVRSSGDRAAIAGARIDVWQADGEGLYDMQRGPVRSLRGCFVTDSSGRYAMRTVLPVSYPIPHDGPVGRLLERTGRHPYRPAHIHAIVSADGYESLTTQIFVSGDRWLSSDAVFAVKPELIAEFRENPPGIAPDGSVLEIPFYTCTYDFSLHSCGSD
jgi:maleylacetate reductase